jgi:AraC-like DNA-binding protein
MRNSPELLSDRPAHRDDSIDVVGDILETVQLTTAVYGRLELGTPWQLRVPTAEYLSFYVVARGGGWMQLEGDSDSRWVALSAGDAVVLTQGTAHTLWDSNRSDASPETIDYGACPRSPTGEAVRFGGSGPVTSVVTGHFTMGGSVSRNPLLNSLPRLIHLPADASASHPQLAGVVPLILSESARPGPGATMVLARLADLLLIQALRYRIDLASPEECGLHAVSDPSIGCALRLMHARAAEPWTVESLASSVAMSRSAFAARFTKLVGEPPLQYLTRWRMTLAARLLSAGEQSVASVAEHVGYANAVAFTKAFKRYQGVGPGAYRRAHRSG